MAIKVILRHVFSLLDDACRRILKSLHAQSELSDIKTKGFIPYSNCNWQYMPAIDYLPQTVIETIHSLDEFIVEEFKINKDNFLNISISQHHSNNSSFHELNKHEGNVLKQLFSAICSPEKCWSVEQTGCPAVC